MFVMAREPANNMNAADVRAYFSDKYCEKDLADAYAIAHNKFWWVEDNEYDYEEGSPEHKAACAITDEWGALMNEYKRQIFEILKIEGIVIPKTGQIKVLEPFMERYGYMRFFDQAKKKAITFSYDDGVTQDIRLIEL